MKRLTKLNPTLAPLAIAEITRRCIAEERDYVAFKGLCYELDKSCTPPEVWHVCASWSDNEPYDNTWTDDKFSIRA